VHTECFHYGDKIGASGRETETIQTSATSSCAGREAVMFAERQPGTKLSLLTPALPRSSLRYATAHSSLLPEQ